MLLGASASPAVAATRNLHIVVDVNHTSGANHWTSSGAFIDEGTVDNGPSVNWNGLVIFVTDTPQGADGSFTWTFRKTFGSIDHTRGSWEITGGTGRYEGMTGRGIVSGTYDASTEDIHDEFSGAVECPNC
jgi:hypothetical protein